MGDQKNDDRISVLETSIADNTRKFADINVTLGIDPNGDPVAAIKSLNERVTTMETSIKDSETKTFDSKVDTVIAKFTRYTDADGRSVGKVTPADVPSIKAMVAGFAATADDNGTLKFGVGDSEKTGTVVDALIAHFERAPVVVEYDESGKVKSPAAAGSDDDKSKKFVDDDVKRFADDLSDVSESDVIVDEFDESAVREYMTKHKVDYVTAFAAVVPGAAMVVPPTDFPSQAIGNA
jgi:hypothetical protein